MRRVVWDHHSNDLVRNQNLPKLNLQSHVVPDAALLRGDAIQTATSKPTPLFCDTALFSAVSVGAVARVTPLPHLHPPCTLRSTHCCQDSNCRAVTFVSVHAALPLQVVLEPTFECCESVLKISHPARFLSVPPQVPDYTNAKILGLPATTVIDDKKWLEEEFTPRVQTVSEPLHVGSPNRRRALHSIDDHFRERMQERVGCWGKVWPSVSCCF